MKANSPTRVILSAGVGMIGATLAAPIFSAADAFSIVGLVWGSLLLSLGAFLHHAPNGGRPRRSSA